MADEPAATCYLPEHRVFLRRLAADSEAGVQAAAEAVLADPGTQRKGTAHPELPGS
ncbi:Imm21 family immunity protein [Streptomyces yangpuensis]|uniref:Imm21 family immunity protein n=1 Tax=Streptomyces yangpuensis TaxID=1648182 RepID=UPI00099EE690|nr:Imm21 family immunity protein [Streptomyces yangpuensis]